MIDIKSEVLQETNSNDMYDTKVYLEGTIDSLLGEASTALCKLVEMMVDILEPYKGRVYDPCCGSGGMFVQCSKFVKEHQGNIDSISIFGQESNPGTWKMAKMNLAIRGLEGNLGEKNGDSFTEDLHKNLRADYILANPPYNLKEFWKPSLEGDPRWVFGKPDTKNGNYAWLSLMYAKLSPKGKAAILMPNGATTSNNQDDFKIRKNMGQYETYRMLQIMVVRTLHVP